MKEDKGFWKKEQLLFYPKLQIIEECCNHKPLVLFYDELKGDPWVFFDKISKYSETTYSKEKISLGRVHTSYTEKQLKVLKRFCGQYVRFVPSGKDNRLVHWITYRPWWAFFHLVMYVAALLPMSWVPKKPLIDPGSLKVIDSAYQEDWKKIVQYARDNNPK